MIVGVVALGWAITKCIKDSVASETTTLPLAIKGVRVVGVKGGEAQIAKAVISAFLKNGFALTENGIQLIAVIKFGIEALDGSMEVTIVFESKFQGRTLSADITTTASNQVVVDGRVPSERIPTLVNGVGDYLVAQVRRQMNPPSIERKATQEPVPQ